LDQSYDEANAVTVDSDGNVIVLGESWASGQSYDVWLRKYTGSGSELWTVSVPDDAIAHDMGRGLALFSDDDIATAGRLWQASQDAWIARFNP
jgi:hypothetical protein